MNEQTHETIARLASGKPAVEAEAADPDAGLSREMRHQRWQSKRPSLSHLQPGTATANGITLPLFDIGDRIVVDCSTDMLKNRPWLETIVGRVKDIDDETGLVSIIDEESDPRLPIVRYGRFNSDLFQFFLAPAKGNPLAAPVSARADAKEVAPLPPGKRRRGRPKGSKNKPKDSAAT